MPRDLRAWWRRTYHSVFAGEREPEAKSAALVLAHLRDYACARPEQTDVLVMHEEYSRDPRAYERHVERVRMYRQIQGVLDIPDAQVEQAERRINEMLELGEEKE